MKLNSISGLVFHSRDLSKTADFYGSLGFALTKQEPELVSIRLNWFWADFVPASGEAAPKNGPLVYISVDNVDEACRELQAKGYKFNGEPTDGLNGRREAVLPDPDGYELVFFSKK